MEAQAMVVARVVEGDADAAEGLARAKLHRGRHFDRNVLPAVGPDDPQVAPDRPCGDLLDADLIGRGDELIRLGRRVVVAVTGVVSVDETADPVDAVQLEGAVVGDGDPDEAVLEAVAPRDYRAFDGSSSLYRPDSGPDERRGRNVSRQRAARARDDPELPKLIRAELGRRRGLLAELLDVEPDRVVLVVPLQRQPTLIDCHAVQTTVEELTPVESPHEPWRNVAASKLVGVQEGLVVVDLLRADDSAVRKLERDVFPLLRDSAVELD